MPSEFDYPFNFALEQECEKGIAEIDNKNFLHEDL
jgi:hypothetical protein